MTEIYRDQWLVVIDKPVGMPTQSTAKGEPGLFERLQQDHEYVQHCSTGFEQPPAQFNQVFQETQFLIAVIIFRHLDRPAFRQTPVLQDRNSGLSQRRI